MGSRRKVLIGAAALLCLMATSFGSAPATKAALSQPQPQPQPQPQDLRTQRTQLVVQLQTLLANEHSASAALLGAEAQYMSAQNGVLAVRAQMDAANAKLVALQQQINAEEQRDSTAERQLSLLTRATYETTNDRSLLANVLSSDNFADAMLRLHGADSVQSQVSLLQGQLVFDQISVAHQRAALQKEFAQASALERQISNQSNAFLVAVAVRNAALAQASQPVRDLEAQIATIDNELAGNMPPVSSGSCANHFAYGQCTWYVATRRCIPWTGNADQWYHNAAAMGFSEGQEPVVGAVVVFRPGGDGAGSVGHVGYVEQVGPAGGTPAGYFELSEMNGTAGWGRVDYRDLPNNSSGIQGFIYGHP